MFTFWKLRVLYLLRTIAISAMVRDGYDPAFGARPVKRLIQRELVNLLAREILEGKVSKNSTIEVDWADGKTVLRNK